MTVCSLVTGASRGIGAAVAEAIAAAGHRVAVHAGRDAAAAERVRAGLPGSGHVVVVGDLTSADSCERVVKEAVAGLGDLDVLVKQRRRLRQSPDHRDHLLRLAGDLAAHGRAQSRGPGESGLAGGRPLDAPPARSSRRRLISVGSRGAFRGEPVTPAYGASKAGLHALTQSLAVALAPHGIVAAAVAPGFVETDMAQHILDGPQGPAIRAQSPFNRVAAPAEVAAVVKWLVTDAPPWVTGAVLDANGASYLR